MAKVVAKKAAPASKAAPAKATAKEAKEKGSSRYVGLTSGLRITEFQNKTLLDNRRNKLTDEQLAKSWRDEFPKAAAFTDKTVRGVRGLVNLGKHKNDAPTDPVHAYDEEGNKLPLRGEKKAAKDAAKADTKAEVKGPKAVLKMKKKA